MLHETIQANALQRLHRRVLRFSCESMYAEAHGLFGTELAAETAIPRTFISTTANPLTAKYFAGAKGVIYVGKIPLKSVVPQIIEGATESEYLIRLGSDQFKPFMELMK